MIHMKGITLIPALIAAAATASAAPELNPGNIDEVIAAMSLEQKASVVVGYSASAFTGYGNSTLYVPGSAASTAYLEELGILPTVLADGPAGVRINPTRTGTDKTYYCTAFPIGTALSSSWNTELVSEVGRNIGNEAKEYGVDILLAPGLNLHRDPLCGRNFEYFSEDPVLTGKIAAAYVNGVQSNGVGTSVKHFAVNNAETNRKDNDSRLSQRALRELYLKGFEIAVKEAAPWTVMSAYNAINGVQAMESRELLTDILRGEWGFDGYVMCDWAYAGLRNTAREIHAGNDLLTPGSDIQKQEVIDAVNDGALSMEDLDTAVRNILGVIVRTHRFKGEPYSESPDLDAHAKVARQAAAESMVLLKNDGVLPLDPGIRNVGLFGISSYEFMSGGTGSGSVNRAYCISLVDGLRNQGFSVNAEVAKYYREAVGQIRGIPGTKPVASRTSLNEIPPQENSIRKSAAGDDIAFVTIGRSNGEGLDRHWYNDFTLTATEIKLLRNLSKEFHKKGKKVVAILNISGAVSMEELKKYADAILCCWLPGQEGGNAVMDVLTGKENPSGRLPMTIPASYFDSSTYPNFPYDYVGPVAMGKYTITPGPARKNVHYTNYEEGIYVGYRHYDTRGIDVAYPFGYGLSYTSFEYSEPEVAACEGGFTARLKVTNSGAVAGKEVVQLYVSAPKGRLDKPKSELKAFAKTGCLAPGESQILEFEVSDYNLASFNDRKSRWESERGEYAILFAANVRDVRATASYTLRKTGKWKVGNLLKPADH